MGSVDPPRSRTLVCGGLQGQIKIVRAQSGLGILLWQQPPAPLKKINVTRFRSGEKGLFIPSLTFINTRKDQKVLGQKRVEEWTCQKEEQKHNGGRRIWVNGVSRALHRQGRE